MRPIILASQSPRRKQLLEWANIEFEIVVRETDEQFPPGMAVTEIPIHIARNKAAAITDSEAYKKYELGTIILAADTIVVLDQQVIGKPNGKDDAIRILGRLSGRTHQVITGVVMRNDSKEQSFSVVTEVSFNTLSPDQIHYYVDNYRPYDKAGAYAIQEWIGVIGINSINGDFYNVMGLPVNRVVKTLSEFA